MSFERLHMIYISSKLTEGHMKVKNDHRSTFSNLSSSKEEA